MKRNNIIIIAILVIISSCESILEEKPVAFIDPYKFYNNETECRAAVNYLYFPLTNFYKANLLFVTDLSTDLSFFTGSSVDPVNNFAISPAQPGTAAINAWNNCYTGIVQANNTISGIQRTSLDEATKQALIGEASCLRGFYYYILTELFNDVPFYFDEVLTVDDQNKVGRIPRMSALETRNTIIEDLEQYLDYLPIKNRFDKSFQRVSRQFAYMLIAKMAMKNFDFELAKFYLIKIREIYGYLDPGVYPINDTYFSNKNTPESIFEVQYMYDPSGIQKQAGVAVYFIPPLSTPGTDVFDGVSIPFIGNAAATSNPAKPTEYLISLYEKIEGDLGPELNGIDPRKRITLAYSYNGQEFNRVKTGGKPYFGIKYWCPNQISSNGDGNNQPVFRYADALLMLAECYNEEPNRDASQSLAILQEVRQRAGYINFFTNTSKRAILKEIQEERARELFGEYQRKFDLVRWGIFYEQIRRTSGLENPILFDNVKPFHKYLPIPDTEVVRTQGILTNEDYQ